MSGGARLPFDVNVIMVDVENLVPRRQLNESIKKTPRYQSLLASIRELGIFEPLNVFPRRGGKYDILNGHVRSLVARELGLAQVPCLVAKDDEAYTYNYRVSRVAPVQAARMMRKVLEKVPAARIAQTLGISEDAVRQQRSLLDGICPEAVELLKDKPVAVGAFGELRKVIPFRQYEIAEAMNAAAKYTKPYAQFLVGTTPKEQLTEKEAARREARATPEDISRLERELYSSEKEYQLAEEKFSRVSFEWTLARGYVNKLLGNRRVLRFLEQNRADLLAEFQRVGKTDLPGS